MTGVMLAMRDAPELRECLCDQVFTSRGDTLRLVVARAVARGELPPESNPELAHEVAAAMWAQRALVVGAPVDDAFIAHVADDVLIPLLSRSSPTVQTYHRERDRS